MGAQGLRCLNRYPSLLPGLAVAKTRHTTGMAGMLGQGDEPGGDQEGRPSRSEGREERTVGWDRAKGEMGRYRGVERKRKEEAEELQGKEVIRKKRKKREEGSTLTQPFPSAAHSLWSKAEMGNKSCCSEKAAAVGQVSVCHLGPDLSWAWEAKQPWGQETSLRRGEGSGPSKVGGVRICAPPLLTPKFSPDGPSATVPVLGCSFP